MSLGYKSEEQPSEKPMREIKPTTRYKVIIPLCFIAGLLSISMSVVIYIWSYNGGEFINNVIIRPLIGRRTSRFDFLTEAEIDSVTDFSIRVLKLTLITEAKITDDYISNIYMLEPKKCLRMNANCFYSLRDRFAVVVVSYGSKKIPVLQEYLVGPLIEGQNLTHESIRKGRTIDFNKRPLTSPEFIELSNIVMKAAYKVRDLLRKVYNITEFSFCEGPQCLFHMYATPHVFPDPKDNTAGVSQERRTWFRYTRNIMAFYHYPIDLQVLVNHNGVNVTNWSVESVWCQGHFYPSMEKLHESWINDRKGRFSLRHLYNVPSTARNYDVDNDFEGINSSANLKFDKDGMLMFEAWRMKIAFRPTTGIRLFTITYNNRTIAYELGLSETATMYSGASPYMGNVFSIESYFGVGSYTFNQKSVFDCPASGQYFSTWTYQDGKSRFIKQAVCAFEWNMISPLYRHLDLNFQNFDNSKFQSVRNHVLVVRSICTLFNYDYIFDYVFHRNGVIEVAVTATGQAHVDVVMPLNAGLGEGWQNYGYVISGDKNSSKPQNGDIYGAVHLHLFHFKFDLDIEEVVNNVQILKLENRNKYIIKTINPNRESEAILTESSGSNYYLYCSKENPRQCYRILNRAETHTYPPQANGYEKGVRWAKWNIATSVRYDNESSSSSSYNGINPLRPEVDFDSLLLNNETITNKDLVAWIKMGVLHIPHLEDFPYTTTPGGRLQTFLIPNNFFNCDPESDKQSQQC